jgi:arylsulfatase A
MCRYPAFDWPIARRCSAIRKAEHLLIVLDDMGFGDIGMSDNPVIRTPRLDQLASESINFSNFYVLPVCAPTRASLLTGRYHQRTGVRSVTNGFETLNPEEITLAEILSREGYHTGLFGKWHLGEHYPTFLMGMDPGVGMISDRAYGKLF